MCGALGPDNFCAGIACIPNFSLIACAIGKLVLIPIAYAVLFGSIIAHQALDHRFEKQTLGPAEAIYGYEYSKATYLNTKQHIEWNADALTTMNEHMWNQHDKMMTQLQEHHKDMTNHLGNDVSSIFYPLHFHTAYFDSSFLCL